MKFFYILFTLLGAVVSAQNNEMFISPIYSDVQPKSYEYIPRMVTYCDINSVTMNFYKLLHDKMGLSNGEQKENFASDLTAGTITDEFNTPAGKKIDKLNLKYNVFEYHNLWVVKSVDITGDLNLLMKFYIYAYPGAKVEQGDFNKREFVYTNYLFDKITFNLKGKPSIKITNTQFKNIAEFDTYRENSKREFLESKKQKEMEATTKTVQQQASKTKATKSKEPKVYKPSAKSDVWIVIKDKKGVKIIGAKEENVIKAIQDRMANEKNGKYSVFVKNIYAENLDLKVTYTGKL
ncbi:hypothetical protein [Ornithobacterium rhinotracheale]